jgi:DNA-binding beta-propeller fold protein YncE
MRTSKNTFWIAVSLALVVLAFGSTSALAAGAYRYEQGLSEQLNASVPGGAFASPWTLTFDAEGDLFVSDPASHAIDKFNAADAFLAPQLGLETLTGGYTRGVAVNDETHDIYVGDSNHSEVIVLNGAGELLSQWTGANTPATTFGASSCCFVFTAVDNSASPAKGDVYVMTTQNGGEVDVLEPQGGDKVEGKYLRSLEVPPGGFAFDHALGRDGLAVDDSSGPEAGEVYVVNTDDKTVDRFGPEGKFEQAIEGPSAVEPFEEPVAVAVDDATGDVFVADAGAKAIDKFSAAGTFLTQIRETSPGETLREPLGVAVQQGGANAGDVFVSDGQSKLVDVFAVPRPSSPHVDSVSALGVSADSATVAAEITPNGEPTEYRFEYGPCATPATCAASPYPVSTTESALGAEDFEPHSTQSLHVQGLAANTTYHFRVVASNSHGQGVGEERTFTTQSAGGELVLPDGRQWELVSPPDKHGSILGGIAESGMVQAAASGDGISYQANAPTEAQPQGHTQGQQILSLRSPTGWASQDLSVPHDEATGAKVGVGGEYAFFGEDLSESFVEPLGAFDPAISPLASEQTPFLRSDYLNGNSSEPCQPQSMECFRPLVTGKPGVANVPAGTVFVPEYVAATSNAKHAVLRSYAGALTEEPAGELGLYEWNADASPSQQLRLISVLPDGQPASLAKLGYTDQDTRGAISANGGEVIFEQAKERGAGSGALYLRDTSQNKTIQLDAAESKCSSEGECESGRGRFQFASRTSTVVLFTDSQRLTADAGAEPGEPGKADLYRCEIVMAPGGGPECSLSDLTPAGGGGSADVQGSVIGASEDGAWVYFVASGVLAGNADSQGEHAVEGLCNGTAAALCNLYLQHGGETRLVAVLSGEDIHDWDGALQGMPARVSPNGQWIELMSQRSLTGYDNRDAHTGKPTAEVYLYNAATEGLVCASCQPSGARPVGVEYHKLVETSPAGFQGATWEPHELVAANVPGWIGDTSDGGDSRYQPRYLSNEGRLFFDTADGLVPQDVNAAQDVYQYEPQGLPEPAGVSGCTNSSPTFSASSGGCVSLISSGESAQDSSFLDASESGGDVFFETYSQLVSADKDTSRDVYDAHQCTAAAPCLPAAAAEPPPCDTGDSCKAAPSAQPEVFGAPASALFSGVGNLTPTEVVKVKAKAKPETRAQKLAKALKACQKKAKGKRAGCEKAARKQYGLVKKSKRKKR